MKSPLRTAAKHGFVPPFVPPFRFVPPLWIQIRHGDGHTKPAGGKVMLPASWPPAPAAQWPGHQRLDVQASASGRHFSFCWYFCWYFSGKQAVYRGRCGSLIWNRRVFHVNQRTRKAPAPAARCAGHRSHNTTPLETMQNGAAMRQHDPQGVSRSGVPFGGATSTRKAKTQRGGWVKN